MKHMALVINTPSGKNPSEDEVKILPAGLLHKVSIF
jgi:hypothetical protein